jgi:hypothetical protein
MYQRAKITLRKGTIPVLGKRKLLLMDMLTGSVTLLGLQIQDCQELIWLVAHR